MAEHNIKKIDDYKYIIEKSGDMRVPAIFYSNPGYLEQIIREGSYMQLVNVASLPGIIGAALAMPDMHQGYGFPIGGVAAMDIENGVISPGGVGYDINCGCRLVRTNLTYDEIKGRVRDIINALYSTIPTGVGSKGDLRLSRKDAKAVSETGAKWLIKKGYGEASDLEHTEDEGEIEGADPDLVSERAYERGKDQLGSLGSGNHFIELGVVDEIYDEKAAAAYGLRQGFVTLFIHTGSRGFGHQVCDDSLEMMTRYIKKSGIYLPDRQLACAHFSSDEGQKYFKAMKCAANYAFANRQLIMFRSMETISRALKMSYEKMGVDLVYDVCHNIAKVEEHEVDGIVKKVCVHRKGATRSFPAGHMDVPKAYRDVGQPVLIPGDMGRYSYVLSGGENAMKESFGSTCHGAGRVLSRHKAIKMAKGRSISRELEDKNIYVIAKKHNTLKEEMSDAYKDVSKVVDVVSKAGISKKVAKMRPLGVIKG
ncbi:RtcB family protein [Thermodesulfobacteriota bacterium]